MPLKIKRKSPRVITEDFLPEEKTCLEDSTSCLPDFSSLTAFTREWNLADSYPLRYRVLRTWWPKTCEEEMPKFHADLLQTRIAYELQARAYIDAAATMPKSVAQNLAAMRVFKVEEMTPNMRRMLEISIANKKQGEEQMARKTAEKGARQNVSQFYLEVFEGQAKAQLTDAQIVETIEKKTGNKPSAKNVASYRCMYNAGKLEGQKGVPIAKVKAVRPKSDKPKVKKPMSEETKAKLKAYTAAKKKKLTVKRK